MINLTNIADSLILEEKGISFKSKKLNYSFEALEPYVSRETLEIHYNKHYKNYIKTLNDLIKDKNVPPTIEKVISRIKNFDYKIRFNAGGVLNHEILWNSLSDKKTKPDEKLLTKINKQFGSLNEFKKKFVDIGKQKMGSGWIWLLISNKGKLKIVMTPNQDNPMMNIFPQKDYLSGEIKENIYGPMNGKILFGLDLWEHAYYLDYRNDKEKYIANFFDHLNWDFVNENYINFKRK